ncbi:DUF3168 domain-containing protein [Breoghania sp.]|uniref:DUF3168 domain-containing protein n=1 Tax=Breoghania sp. TaxID=2065378 RepID=UPI002AAB93CE|nr:DUF3168 domain-containing protein [Breoghania sp.]
MSHAALELQAAFVAALRADGALSSLLGEGKVADGARRAAAWPNIALGEWASRSIAGDGWPGEEHRLEFLVFSRAGGRSETLGLMTQLAGVIAAANPTLAQHRLVSLERQREEVQRTRDGRGWRGRIVYRAVTEPAALV